MRTKNIWKSLLMSAALLVSGAMVSCEKEPDDHPADLDAQLKAVASQEIVQLGETFTIDVVCNTDWRLNITNNEILVDEVSAYSGKGNQTISVKVIADPQSAEQSDNSYVYAPGDAIVFDFEADGYVNSLKFTRHSTVSVKVGTGEEDIEHAGTLEDPLSVVNARAKAIEAGQNADDAAGPYYIKGVISKVATSFAGSGTYGNANFYIKDNLTDEDDFYAFQVYYLGHKQWISGWKDVEVGDQVIVYGRVYNYMGSTPETVGKGDGYIYSHNGETEVSGGGTTDPTPGDTNFADGEYYLFGKLDTNSNNVSLAPYIHHAWTGTISANGDLNTVNYQYDEATSTFTLNPGLSEQDAAKGTAAVINIEAVSGKDNTYYIKVNGKYLYSTEAATNRKMALGNDASKAEWTFTANANGGYTAIHNGIYLGSASATYDFLRSYKNEATLKAGLWLYSASTVTINNNGGGTTDPDPTPGGTKHAGSLDDPFTVADAIVKCQEIGDTQSTDSYYIKGVIKSLGDNFGNNTYGNGTFYIKDANEDNEFYAYRIYYLENKQWQSGNTIPQVGDEVVIFGKITNYKGNTPETVQGSAYLYSLNGKTTDDGGNGGGTTDPDPTPGDGSFESDEAFVCTASASSNPSGLGASTFNGSKATGFKLGTGSKVGSFTSEAVGVTGDYTLSLYGVAWKGQKGTLKVSVNGGGSVDGTDTYDLTSNDGATGTAPFTITVTDSDKYTFNLKGLTSTSTITFETVGTAYRVVVAGVHLTNGTSGGGSTEPEQPTPGGDKGQAVIDMTATGVSGTAYVTSAQTFTIDEISYTAHNFNPKSGQVKGNQTAAASNFYISNNTGYSGKIKTITMTTGATDTAKFQNNCYCATGNSAISTPEGTGTAGTISADGKTITWELNSNDSYFMISSKEKYTSGSATAVTITVTYE